MIEQLPLLDKRWNQGRQRFVPPTITVNPDDYTIAPISFTDSRTFVSVHHYAGNMPASRLNVGLMRDGTLVGVAVFSHPMSEHTLEKHIGHRAGTELGRFVQYRVVFLTPRTSNIARGKARRSRRPFLCRSGRANSR